MRYVTLLLQPTAVQEASLTQLLAAQQDRSSPKYRQWLTPELYADSFGLNPADMAKIAGWLKAEGFTVNYQARGRNWLAFSGDAAQIQRTFRTAIHQYTIGNEKHFANTTNPSIPTALAGIVTHIQGLDDFRPKPAYARGGSVSRNAMRPNFTSGAYHYLAPDDIATIYDLTRLYSEGINGTAQIVVVVGQTDFYTADIGNFRSSFNLPNQPIQPPPCAINSLCTILYGPDPGIVPADLPEAELDLELSGSVARNAAIYYVYSTNVFTSVQYAIDNDIGPVIGMSYGGCEAGFLGSLAWEQTLAQEGNSLGITWVTSSGDGGAADCDWLGDSTGTLATQGLAVDFPASIPEVTGVGGTEFNEGNGTYWNLSNGANGGSALSYIPEMGWDDTAFGTGLSGTLAASGGGVSIYYPTPSWQTGPGFPNDGFRDVPDVSFSASWDHDGYLVCIEQCPAYYSVYGGTSAATPVFAGMLGLLNQFLVDTGAESQAGLGNINPSLYALHQSTPSVFHDVSTGSNVVPCQVGTPDCSTGSFGYYAQAGYDQVTGLGSIDGYNLINAWTGPRAPQLIISKSHSGNFTQGQNGATYTVTVNNAGGGPTSGAISVIDTLPAGLTLVSMSGPGWICLGSGCTASAALAPGASYPPIAVTVNVAVGAPAQVTNQVAVSGGGSPTASASDPTIIQPLLAAEVMSRSTPTGCTAPPSATEFLVTDIQAVLWFQVGYANAGDQATANWYAPNGTLYTSASWLPVASAGSWCFWDPIDIAGYQPGLEPGTWSVTLVWNNSVFFTQYFTIGYTFPVPSDFNHDGHPDVIWEEPTVGWAQVWYLGGAQGVSITGAADLTKANPWNIVGVGDFNGDGNPDVVWQDPVSGAVQVWYLGGAGGVTLIGAADIATKNPWKVVSVADFNQDGHPDLLWEDPTSGFAQIWYLGGPQGITLLGAANLTQTNPWHIVGCGDFNNDGFPDVLWQDPVSGTVQIWYMGGTAPGAQGSQLMSALNLTGAMTTEVVAIADFNRDGHPDVVFQNEATGAATVYYYTGPLGTIPNGTAVLSTGNPWHIAGPH
jgi:uncharacterized repeat protein (TIGR01451 family)